MVSTYLATNLFLSRYLGGGAAEGTWELREAVSLIGPSALGLCL